jgi:8-oxo-dGTP pyrophosphatase MutT (NUDIX family)
VTHPRTIHLRRPATLAVQQGVYVPQTLAGASLSPNAPGLLDQIEQRWTDLLRSNPAYFDGRLYHVLGVHRNGHGGAVLHVIDCAYRFLAVQNDQFDLGVRALGIKGVIERDGTFLMGRRAGHVAMYQNLWEFAPAGGMEPGKSPTQILREELAEETGLSMLGEPVALAVLFDPVLKCWELVYRLQVQSGEPTPRTNEYSQLIWRPRHDLPHDLSPVARQIAAII